MSRVEETPALEFVWRESADSRWAAVRPMLPRLRVPLLKVLVLYAGLAIVGALIRLSPVHTVRSFAVDLAQSSVIIVVCVAVGCTLYYFLGRWIPGDTITVSPRGVHGLLNQSAWMSPDLIQSIRVAPMDKGRFELRVVYSGSRRGPELRRVWLDPAVDPLALEQFLRDQGWPIERESDPIR